MKRYSILILLTILLLASGMLASCIMPPVISEPPAISGVSVSSITETGATISWQTNKTSDSQVEYGTTSQYGFTSPLSSELVTNHCVTLGNLEPNAIYHFKIISKGADGKVAESKDKNFTTLADITPPTILDIAVSQISETGAVITWTTDEPATSQVEYGGTSGYGLDTPVDETRATSHKIILSNLTLNSTYHYRVKSRDSSGNLAISSDFTFTTLLLPNAEDKDAYATIIKLVDSKGNCELHSEYNGSWPTYTGEALYRPAKVGETITLRVDVYNAIANPVLHKYQFTGTGFISDWQLWRPDNKITMTVTERLQTFRCIVYVKNSDDRYRTAEFDDMIALYYKLVP